MSDERVYQIPPADRWIRPVDVVEVMADEAEDVTSLVRTNEAKRHMVEAAKHLRWAAAAERSMEVAS